MTLARLPLLSFVFLQFGCSLAEEFLGDSATKSETAEEDLHWPETEACKVNSSLPGWRGCTQISTTEGC